MTDQIKLLNNLAKKIKAQEETKQQAVATLASAGILNKKGKLTTHYPNLARLIEKSN